MIKNSNGMKVLTIGTDRKLFEEGSSVLTRTIKYASKVEEMHIVVFSQKKQNFSPVTIGNLYLYPTNSRSRFHYILDAITLGKKVILECKFVRGDSVISSQDPFETGLVGYSLKKKFRLPLQIQVHTNFLSSNFKTGVLNRIRVIIARFLIPRGSSVRVVSESIQASIQRKFKNHPNMDLLPVYVDIKKIINHDPRSDLRVLFPQFKFIILMASRLTIEKRIDVALNVLKKVIAKFPHTGLIISGDGAERGSLEALSIKLGLRDNIKFMGWQEDVVSSYKTANTFLLTSDYEGYGMTLIEAGASGCSIVTTNVGVAQTELFKNNENSFVCPVGDIDCLSNGILELISDNQKRELFQHRMRDSIKSREETIDEYADKYVILLSNTIKNASKV